VLQNYIVDYLDIGAQGEMGLLFFPSKTGYVRDKKGLKWALRAYRLSFTKGTQN
jgi:uncharacterized glyoxalase superfamily protein PhnB